MSGLWLYSILDFKLVRVSVCVCILSFVIFWHCLLYSSPVLGFHSFCFVLFFFCQWSSYIWIQDSMESYQIYILSLDGIAVAFKRLSLLINNLQTENAIVYRNVEFSSCLLTLGWGLKVNSLSFLILFFFFFPFHFSLFPTLWSRLFFIYGRLYIGSWTY